MQSTPHEKQLKVLMGSLAAASMALVAEVVPLSVAPSPFVCFSGSSLVLISFPFSSYTFRRSSRFRSALVAGVADSARSVDACGFPGVVKVFCAG